MTHTRDFEHVLDLENVVGVEYDEDDDTVRTFVRRKVPEADLDSSQVVGNQVDRESDVAEVGEVRLLPEDVPEAQGDRKNKHRPVVAGVSEANAQATAATNGPLARVVDKSKGRWGDNVKEGDIVRVSNNHVYARINKASFGEPIIQPSRLDHGTPGDTVGHLAGYVTIDGGVTVDAAARTVGPVEESEEWHGTERPTGVLRGDYSVLKSETLKKTGRTTGVTRGQVRATNASIRVNYGEPGVITLRDQIITDDMSDGGDSGSAVAWDSEGKFVGLIFAGSEKISIICKAENIENELGVRFMPERDGGGNDRGDKMQSLNATVDVPMEEPNLDLLDLSGDKPLPNETVTLTAVVGGNVRGTAYLMVQGQEYRFDLESEEREGLPYSAEVKVDVKAPDVVQESFPLTVKGGYVL